MKRLLLLLALLGAAVPASAGWWGDDAASSTSSSTGTVVAESTSVYRSSDYGTSNVIPLRFTHTGTYSASNKLRWAYQARIDDSELNDMAGFDFRQTAVGGGDYGEMRLLVRVEGGGTNFMAPKVRIWHDGSNQPRIDFGSANAIDSGGVTTTVPIIRIIGTGVTQELTNTSGKLIIGAINATGTPDSSNYLRGDGTWASAGSGGSSSLAVTTGTSAGFGVAITSPTAVLKADNAYFGVTAQGTTAFLTLIDIPAATVDGTKLDLSDTPDSNASEYLVAWSSITGRGRPFTPVTTYYYEVSRESPRFVENGTNNAFVVDYASNPAYGLMAFAATVSSESNCGYFPMPQVRDFNSSVDMRLDEFRVLIGSATDNAAQRYYVSIATKTVGVNWKNATYGNTATVDMANTLGTVAGEERALATSPTLTGWAAIVSSGVPWAVKVCRDGDDGTNDASTVDSRFSMLTIRAGHTVP